MYFRDKITFFSFVKFIGEILIIVLCLIWLYFDPGQVEPITVLIASILTFSSDYFVSKKEQITIERLRIENEKLSNEINKTKNEILNEVTGGDSYAIISNITIPGENPPCFQFYIQNLGNYTLYDVAVGYYNAEEMNQELLKTGGRATFESMKKHKKEFIGNIVPRNLALFGEIYKMPEDGKLDIDFTIILRNGVYHQQFRGRRSTEYPEFLTSADRLYKTIRGKPGKELISESFPPDFPEEEKSKIKWSEV